MKKTIISRSKEERFQGIYEPNLNDSSSSSEEENEINVQFGKRKLSAEKKTKFVNYLFFEINISR